MSILSARTLRDSLQKAKGVGLVEERFTVGDCEVVVRNLRPDHYEDILADCKGLDDVGYLNAFQIGHVSRAIIELNGQDFRDVEDRKSTRLNSSHIQKSRMPSSA